MANPETPTTDNSTPVTPVNAPAAATPESAKPEAKFTQADMDAIAGNTRKEAAAAARKALLKELGIENVDDPDAVKSVKGKLTAAQQAEEANKSELQKLTEKLEKEAAKRAELEAKIAEAERKELKKARDNGVTKALVSAKANANEADDLRILLEAKYPEMFENVFADGKVDEKAVKPLVDRALKEYPKYFQNPAPGSPSNHDGRVPNTNKKPMLNGSLKF